MPAATHASSRFTALEMLSPRYMPGWTMLAGTSVFDAKCITASGFRRWKLSCTTERLARSPFDKFRALTDCGPMSLAPVVEYGDLIARIQ
jgi:hypothetical protein